MKHSLSASTVKGWFQYRCERKVRYETMSNTERLAVPVIHDDRENPWAVKGIDFEDRVVATLSAQETVLRSKGSKKGNQRLSDALAIVFLKSENEAAYAAQLNIAPSRTPSFLERIPGAGI